MKGIDTNILLRYLVRDDEAQAQLAKGLIERRCTSESPGFISLVVLSETLWVLRSGYGYEHEAIIDLLANILATEELVVEQSELVSLALKDYRSGHGFADSLIGWIGRAHGCETTFTFDKKAAQMPGFTLLTA